MATALIESIEVHFSEVENPRRVTKNQYHHFIDILVIAKTGIETKRLHAGWDNNDLKTVLAGMFSSSDCPYALPFQMPREHDVNLLMIGMGTGIAPFREFVQHIYETLEGWQGQVRLHYGARTGLESIYMNDARDDFANYYENRPSKH